MNKSRFLRSSYAQLLISNRKEILCFSSIVLLSTSPSAFALETDHLKPTSLEQTQRQKQTIKGNVKDSNGEPVIGANVKAIGTTDGTITDFDGNFEIQTTPGTTLQISYIGYQSHNVTAQAGRPLIVVLAEDTENLDEVVVVGYGTQRKSDVTGSISVATAEDILKTPAFNALDGLKGKAAGVNIFTNSGQPGGNTRVIIRGIGTINSSSNPLYVVDGVVMEEFQYLNPNDIERMEVLKDASSTAIYGARGANGVILVTTKRGNKKEGSTVSYNGYVSLSHRASSMDVMDSNQFMQAMRTSYQNANTYYGKQAELLLNDRNLFDADGNPLYNTNWQDEATRTAFSQNHQLNILHGGKNTSMGAFLNFTDEQGIMLNSWMKRINAKMAFDAKPMKWLSTGVNVLVNHTWANEAEETGGGQVARRTMIEMPPIFPVKFPDRAWSNSFSSTDEFGFEAMANPVHILETQKRNRYRTQIFGNAALTFHILPSLELRTQIGVDGHLNTTKEYSPKDLINISAPNGRAYISNNDWLYWQEETFLTYNNVFGKHRLNGVLGMSWQARTSTGNSTQSEGFPDDFFGYENIGAGTSPSAPSSWYDKWAMNSYFLRAGYTYNDRYMATVTARVDGSSKFGKNNKYAFFPSVGLGWIISNESFMKDATWLDQLKLHTSYGVTGNSEIGVYRSLATIASGTILQNGNRQPSSYVTRLPNPDLKWEKTEQFDIGFNISMFANRVSFETSYYHKLTKDLLLDRPVPHSTGFSSVIDNIGSVKNQGLEFMLNTVNVQTKDFRWSSTVNLNWNKNEVVKLGANNEDIEPGPWWVSGSQIRLSVGQPLSSFYGYERLGIWGEDEADEAAKVGAKPGEAKRSKDKKFLGKGLPDVTGSFSNKFTYKNFDFTFDLQYAWGVDILQQYMHSVEDRFGYSNGLSTILTDAWSPQNPNTMIQAIRNAPLTGQSSELDSHWVCDGSYLRANLIQLGYTFDRVTLDKIKLDALRIYFSVNNAFVIHSKDFKGFDPEGSSYGGDQWGQNMFFFQYPKPRTFTLGLNITF